MKRVAQNSRKSIVSVYIYIILRDRKNPLEMMTIADIVKKLEEYPYEMKVDRRAVSRCIHTLTDAGIGICYKRKVGMNPGGAWYDAAKIW